MEAPYTILCRLDSGQSLPILKSYDLDDAEQLLRSLQQELPAAYFIRGPRGDSCVEIAAIH